MVAKQSITQWSEVGPWHIGPAAPNGSVPGRRERYIDFIEVYSADAGAPAPDLTPPATRR